MPNDVVTIQFVDSLGEDLQDWSAPQIHDAPIPQVGQMVTVNSTRDSNGNYVYDVARLAVRGRVASIRYTYEIRGKDTGSYQQLVFATVVLEVLEYPQ